ncbi:ATP-binding protein [Streptomyces profundus]|nr:ATP-binding protein [Streptomyces sp. MA3_2.13]
MIAGDFLVTVNPIDGSEIVPCPPGRRPIAPRRATAARDEAAQPGDAVPGPPLLEREEERARLRGLLATGRSVWLDAPSGAGRSALLAAVAEDCAGLAPDGVIHLNGHRRTPRDLLHELYASVHHVVNYRPGPTELSAALREIGAVVVLDDVEFGGAALDEVLSATPECAYLLASRPEAPAPSERAGLDEIALGGLSAAACLELLRLAVARELTASEREWAADLWQAGGGLPTHFIQAGAVLRYRSLTAAGPLPSIGGLAATLVASISEGARELTRFAVVLGGELPEPAVLPALTGDPDAVAAHTELIDCGLLSTVGQRRRLAPGVLAALSEADPAADGPSRIAALTRHFSWWLKESGVDAQEAVAQADVLVAVLRTAQQAGLAAETTELVRLTAPLMAAGLRWGAWERVLRTGQEAARLAGAVAQEAYFHHELGVLAICEGQLARARAELEASIALRGVLSDAGGAVAGRRALTLVDDLTRPPASPVEHTPPAGSPPALVQALPPQVNAPETPPAGSAELTLVIRSGSPEESGATLRQMLSRGNRRNTVATGAGALVAAVLGTVVALALTSGEPEGDPENVTREDPASSVEDEPPAVEESTAEETPSEDPEDEEESESPPPTEDPSLTDPTAPTDPPTTPDPTTPQPTPTESPSPGDGPGGGGGPGGGDTDPPTEDPTDEPTDPPTEPTDPPTEEPTDPPTEDPDPPSSGGGDNGGPGSTPSAPQDTPPATTPPNTAPPAEAD